METITLHAEFDRITAKRKHFTFGHIQGNISGGLYLKLGEEVPDQVIITFGKERKEND